MLGLVALVNALLFAIMLIWTGKYWVQWRHVSLAVILRYVDIQMAGALFQQAAKNE